MIGLTDGQLRVVMDAARMLPVVAAVLAPRGRRHFGDSDMREVTALALCGLIHTDAA